MTGKADFFHIRGSHTFRAGLDARGQYLTGAGSPFTSGHFQFNNQWTRKYDTTLEAASTLGHEWAAFILGMPNNAYVDRQDSYAMRTPYYGWYGTFVDNLRADSTNSWNINLQRNFRIKERLNLQFRVDALNAMNRSQFNGPDVNPTSTTFGKVTSQSAAMNRWLQFQIRIVY
jgi:hypothetical protein